MQLICHCRRHLSSLGLGLSATYTTLLTWLLSLVPDSYDFMTSSASACTAPVPSSAPFVVLGLQQTYLDGKLCLYVAIKATQDFDERDLPDTVKKTKVSDVIAFGTTTITRNSKEIFVYYYHDPLGDQWVAIVVNTKLKLSHTPSDH